MKYIVDIHGEIEGDYEIIGKYEERPKGEWIVTEDKLFCYCSKCKIISIPNIKHKPNFCENCGAEMRCGGEKE